MNTETNSWVEVRGVRIGEGIPKICVPIVGTTRDEILAAAKSFESVKKDVVEWRADWFNGVFDFAQVEALMTELRQVLGNTPVLFTFRTANEGGEKAIEPAAYAELNKRAAATGLIDLLLTDTGKKLTGGAGDMLLKLFSGIQNGDLAGKLANIGTAAANVGNSLSGLLPMLGQLGTTGAGAGMAVGGIGEALGGLGTAIMAALPELLIVVGVLAAIAAVIGGIAWFVSNRKNQNRETHVAKDIGSEIDKGISDGVKEDAPLIDDAVDDVTQNAMDIAKGTLGTISKVMGDDYDYTPQIVPVVDLTNVLEGADEIDNAFASTRSLSLDGDISRNLANQIDAEVQLQNGVKNKGNDDTLNAINGLAGHMDGIVDSIRGMKMTIDGRKTIGYIDNRMGQIAAAKVR